MLSNSEINKKINDTLDSVESIKRVEVSSFFKENVIRQTRNASQDVQVVTWSWFTPKLQLATLVCFVVLNLIAFNNLKETTYNENISSFSKSYGLSLSAESSILN